MESTLLEARTKDAIRLSNTSSMPKFIGFLTPDEAARVETEARKHRCLFKFFGGYDNAERVYFGVYPDWCEGRENFYPITSITFRYRVSDHLSHRDFLGSLMALGIERETVGDILVEEGRTVAFVSRDIAKHIIDSIEKIGNVGVILEEGHSLPLPCISKMLEITDTVASARLDCIVSALSNISRNRAAEIINECLVSVNSVTIQKIVKNISNGDKITVRGKGKFIIESLVDQTKKGRIILRAKKYI